MKNKEKIESRYFAEAEFQRCTPACSLQDMDRASMWIFDAVREAAGIPLVINCAYRSPEWDRSKGRSGNSAHCRGRAIDIRCTTSENRMKIIAAAVEVGVKRIGIGKNFIHLDTDDSLAQNVIWHYYE